MPAKTAAAYITPGILTNAQELRPMKTRVYTVHVLADCMECDFVDEDYQSAVRRAREHAEKTGHEVAVERMQSWRYI